MMNPPFASLSIPAGLDWSEDQCFKLVNDLRSLGLDYSLDVDDDPSLDVGGNHKTALVRKPGGDVIDLSINEALSYLAGAYELAERLAELETLSK
jgi:hypothetical protein